MNRSFVRTNDRIRVPQVRCIDSDGTMLGVISGERAKMLARQQGLDLVEVSPNAEPPVCKITNFGKYRYEEKRKEREAHKKQHTLAIKEIKFHVNVEEHDYQTKLKSIHKFLEKGHKVKLSLFFRGRENVHQELGMQVIKRVLKDCDEQGRIDMDARHIGRSILAVLSPKVGKGYGHHETGGGGGAPAPSGSKVNPLPIPDIPIPEEPDEPDEPEEKAK